MKEKFKNWQKNFVQFLYGKQNLGITALLMFNQAAANYALKGKPNSFKRAKPSS